MSSDSKEPKSTNSPKPLTDAEKRALLRKRRQQKILARGDSWLKRGAFVDTIEQSEPTTPQECKDHTISTPEPEPKTPEMPHTPVRDSPALATPRLMLSPRPVTPPQSKKEQEEQQVNPKIEAASKYSRYVKRVLFVLAGFYIAYLSCLYPCKEMNCRTVSPWMLWLSVEVVGSLPVLLEWLSSVSWGFGVVDIVLYAVSFVNVLRTILKDFAIYLITYIVCVSIWRMINGVA